MNYRILVTGSRGWDDERIVADFLRALGRGNDEVTVVHGGADGADTISANVAYALGYRTEVHFADWANLGKQAGFRRNQEMVDKGADICIAFAVYCRKPACLLRRSHITHGTADCLRRAGKAGIPVLKVTK